MPIITNHFPFIIVSPFFHGFSISGGVRQWPYIVTFLAQVHNSLEKQRSQQRKSFNEIINQKHHVALFCKIGATRDTIRYQRTNKKPRPADTRGAVHKKGIS
ncbi:hypothetical protein [Geobacter metallireducens]|uniref:hypothetical protein n=1 Tax=Geobacter metallireducens TaxID=28232 RepID=UPI0016509747|nr:hypothetical protein [Geobacter metallireducens]